MKTLLLLFTLALLLRENAIETGIASYYGQHWTGRKTASGLTFYADSLTAAHKTLPFGTLVRVTNLKNDSVRVLKITDRLPKSSSRIIDVSYGSAKQLNFIRDGLAKVTVEVIDTATVIKD
jgi:rare lipoprotein A